MCWRHSEVGDRVGLSRRARSRGPEGLDAPNVLGSVLMCRQCCSCSYWFVPSWGGQCPGLGVSPEYISHQELPPLLLCTDTSHFCQMSDCIHLHDPGLHVCECETPCDRMLRGEEVEMPRSYPGSMNLPSKRRIYCAPQWIQQQVVSKCRVWSQGFHYFCKVKSFLQSGKLSLGSHSPLFGLRFSGGIHIVVTAG